MTIETDKNFYKQDSKLYNIENNMELLNWLKSSTTDGYKLCINIIELQKLIENIAAWYERKYSNIDIWCEMKYSDSKLGNIEDEITSQDSTGVRQNLADISRLLNSLPDNQLAFMQCAYRAQSYSSYTTLLGKDDKKETVVTQVLIVLNKKIEKVY